MLVGSAGRSWDWSLIAKLWVVFCLFCKRSIANKMGYYCDIYLKNLFNVGGKVMWLRRTGLASFQYTTHRHTYELTTIGRAWIGASIMKA